MHRDFKELEETIYLPTTPRSLCTNIAIIEDSVLEYDETFEVILTTDSKRIHILNNKTAITIIEDDDSK